MKDYSWKTEKERAWYVDDFIEDQIIPPFREISNKYQFLSFGLICSGIEFYGKCLDDEREFDYSENSEGYFKTALKALFPEYWKVSSKNGISLYKKLRCGLIHSVRPGDRIWLRDKSSATLPHLSVYKSTLHLTIEPFMDDFAAAGRLIVDDIRSGTKYKHAKFYTPFLNI